MGQDVVDELLALPARALGGVTRGHRERAHHSRAPRPSASAEWNALDLEDRDREDNGFTNSPSRYARNHCNIHVSMVLN